MYTNRHITCDPLSTSRLWQLVLVDDNIASSDTAEKISDRLNPRKEYTTIGLQILTINLMIDRKKFLTIKIFDND